MNTPEDPLDELLASWQVEGRAPADFQRQVWHRIAADRRDIPWFAHLLAWWLHPRRLALSAAASVAIGIGLGLLAADRHASQAREAYFSAINPLDSHHQHTVAAR